MRVLPAYRRLVFAAAVALAVFAVGCDSGSDEEGDPFVGTWEVTGAGYEPQGEFRLEGSLAEPSQPLLELLRAGVLSSDAQLVHEKEDQRWHVHGDPTEGALVAAAAKAGLQKPQLDEELPRVDEIPFSSEAKRMTTLHRAAGGQTAYVKGAPEVLLRACHAQLTDGGEAELTEQDMEARAAIAQHARPRSARCQLSLTARTRCPPSFVAAAAALR